MSEYEDVVRSVKIARELLSGESPWSMRDLLLSKALDAIEWLLAENRVLRALTYTTQPAPDTLREIVDDVGQV